jgi:hypothetical protein
MLTDISISKENTFEPLGTKLASFYLTPELRELAVPLAFRDTDGKLLRFTGQTPLIEQILRKVRSSLPRSSVTKKII